MEKLLNKVTCNDCLKVLEELPDNSLDAVITDPPYSSGGLHSGSRQAAPSKKYVQTNTQMKRPEFVGDNKDQRAFISWSTMWASECYRTTKPGGIIIAFTDWRQLAATTDYIQFSDWIFAGIIPWDKTEGCRPRRGGFRSQAEFAVWGYKQYLEPREVYLPGAFRHSISMKDKKYHITAKPLELIEQLVQICPPGGIVLDPFAGSGTTALACIKTGRNFIAVEKTQEYTEIANLRLQEYINTSHII